MRIAVLTDSLADTDGVGRYTMRLFAAMERQRSDLEIEIAIARKHPGISAEVPKRWPIRVALPPDYFFYVSKPRFLAYLAASVARVLPMARRADLVHATKDFPHSFVGLLAAELAGKPCVMTAHGTYSVVPLTDPRHAARARAAYPRYGKILCVSEYTKKRIEELLPLSNLAVIRNAVDASHYSRATGVEGRPWSAAKFTLGVGALKERKGHHVAVAAFLRLAREFPEWNHYIVGAYQENDPYVAAIRAQIGEAGCSNRVVLLGNVTEDEKIDLFQKAAAFVHTPVAASDGGFEGFGIVYLEAAAAGAPSIGTLGSGAEDAVLDGETGFLVNPDADSVAAALRKILSSQGLRETMSARCKEYARSQTWDRNADRVLAVYDELLHGRRPR